MATYLQGVTDYIPRIQPFKPDLNFYQKALESKEADYKAGYDKISKVYGTLLNSPMSRSDNMDIRDKFFSQVQNDIQKLSTVDLSLQQNVNSAYKVFQPIIDDKYIAKDMAFTKAYQGQQSYGSYLKHCLDKECEGKYWDGGMRALSYQREDFMEANREDTLGFGNPSYTPYSDGFNKAMELAKEMKIEVQNVSHDPSGRYIVTTKNGSQLTGPLANYFVRAIGNDPATMEVYRTKAYLARKDYAADNAHKYGGDKMAAEMNYLNIALGSTTDVIEDSYSETKKSLDSQTTKRNIMDKEIQKNGVNPTAQKDFVDDWYSVNEQIDVNSNALDQYSSTLSNIRKVDRNELRSMRNTVDGALAKAFLVEDMKGAAQSYSSLHRSVSMTADPFAVKAFDHQNNLERDRKKFEYDVFLEKYKKDLENGFIQAKREWTEGIPGSGDVGKEPVRNSFADLKTRFSDNAKKSSIAYAQKTYDFYNAMRRSSDPDRSKYGAEKLKEIFKGYIDASFNLQNLEDSPSIDIIGSPDSWRSLYSRANAAIKGDRSIIKAVDEPYISQLNSIEGAITPELNAYDAVASNQLKYNKDVATYLRYNGKSEFKGDLDLIVDKDGREQTKESFIVKWNNRHQRRGDPFFGEDPSEIYDELAEEFLTAYNKKVVPVKNPYTGKMGAGGVGQQPMSTKYDSAYLSLEDKYDLQSLMKDIESTDSFVRMGGNMSPEEGETYTSKDGDVNAKQLFRTILDFASRGGWNPKNDAGKKRPIFNLTISDVGMGRKDYQAYTMELDPIFLETLRGSGKKEGIASNYFSSKGTLTDNKITLYVKDSQAKNNYISRNKLSPYDIIIANDGKYVIDQYKSNGGIAEITRASNGLLASDLSLNILNDDGTYRSNVYPRSYADPYQTTEDYVNIITKVLQDYDTDLQTKRARKLEQLPKNKSL